MRNIRPSVLGLLLAAVVGFLLGIERNDTPFAKPIQDRSAPVPSADQVQETDDVRRTNFLRRIEDSDTYLSSILESSDSLLRRWEERIDDPIRVYLQPSPLSGATPERTRAVRDAFRRWERVAEVPVAFRFVKSEEDAEVSVKWIEAFSIERAGQAEVVWRMDGLLRSGTLTLATHTHVGYPLTTRALFTVALHEIGHLLGLGHSDNPQDVMYPTTGVHDLTMRDRRTAMLLYSLPPGSLGADQ